MSEIYKGYKITHDPKPIGTRLFDWDWHHKDYDIDDDRCGSGASIEDCKCHIDEYIEDNGDEE